MQAIKSGRSALIWIPLLFLALTVFVLRQAIYSGTSPGIVPDELTYMRQAFYGGGVGFGNYLFNDIYSLAQACGDSWYGCVRGLNTIFDLGFSALVVFSAYRILGSFRIAFFIGIAAYTASFLGYGGYFMPDSMFAFFSALTFTMMMSARGVSSPHTILAGVSLGILLLTKPHALALVLGFLALSILISLFKSEDYRARRSTLLIVVAIALLVRVLYGLAVEGPGSLNFFARYFGAAPQGDQSDDGGINSSTDLIAGLASFGLNLVPLIFFLAIIFGLSRLQVTTLLKLPTFQVALTFVISFGLLASVFGGYLEFFGSEETTFRQLTRYWEFTIPLLFVALAAANNHENRSVDNAQSSARIRIAWLVLAAFASVAIGLFPRNQTQADSSLLHVNNWTLTALLLSTLIAVYIFKNGARGALFAFIGPLAALGLVSTISIAEFQTSEKAGTALGYEIREILKQNPSDASRFGFIGEKGAANTAAFIGKLAEHQMIPRNFYGSAGDSDANSEIRWLGASREVFFKGDYLNLENYGDMVLYERYLPFQISSQDWAQMDILVSGQLLPTYWGSWLKGSEIEFQVPSDTRGDTLQIRLLANEKLTDTEVEISFEGRSVTGNLLPNQVLTPVTLESAAGGSWADKRIQIKFVGEDSLDPELRNQFLLGISDISIFNAR